MDINYAIGQRIMAGFPGTEIDDDFAALVREYKVGNVILFRRNIESREQLSCLCKALTELIERETGAIPLIAIDQEGGVVTRLSDDMINTPGAMALAAAGGDSAYRAGAITAAELREAGVNFNLAPVLDVNSNPQNPVIGVRSFGDVPERASALALEFMRGTLDGGVMACGKHFPGHGDTAVDSHLGLPLVEKSREELERCELYPFRAAIKAGIPAIMTSHVLFPALEPERIPATMSRRILTGILRGEFGFDGIIISDCMEMQAIAKFYGTAQGAEASIMAGADIVCISHTSALARDTVERLRLDVESKALGLGELEASVRRIESAKRSLTGGGRSIYVSERAADEAREMLERSFAPVGCDMPPLGERPFFTGCEPIRASLVSSRVRETPAFARYMADRIGGTALVVSENPDGEEIAKAVSAASECSCIVLGTCNAHLKPGQLELMRALGETGKPMAVVALRNPYDLLYMPAGTAGVAAWEYTARSLEALAPFLKREKAFTGIMPLANFDF